MFDVVVDDVIKTGHNLKILTFVCSGIFKKILFAKLAVLFVLLFMKKGKLKKNKSNVINLKYCFFSSWIQLCLAHLKIFYSLLFC